MAQVLVLVLSLVLLACPLHTDGENRHITASECAASMWLDPMPFRGLQAGEVLRWPSLALHGSNGLLVGNTVRHFTSDTIPLPAMAIISLSGTRIPNPPGTFVFLQPKGFFDRSGLYHLFWAEPDSGPPVTGQDWVYSPRKAASLWTAIFDSRHWTWTAPLLLHEGQHLRWSQHGSANITYSDAGFHIALFDNHITKTDLVYLRQDGSTWRKVFYPLHHAAVYPGVAVTGDGASIFVTYIAPDSTQRRDSNSVYLLRSFDRGEIWLPPLRVQRSGEYRAFEAIPLLTSDDSTLHLLWAQDVSGDLTPDRVRHVSTTDAGESWSPHSDLYSSGSVYKLQAVMDGRGTIHVTYQDWTSDLIAGNEVTLVDLWHACWTNAWTEPFRPFPELTLAETAFTTSYDNRSCLISFVRLKSEPQLSPYSGVLSSPGSRCL
jgi:hypothetical protein